MFIIHLNRFNFVTSVKQATNNKLISGCYEGSIKIWDIKTSECIKTINGHSLPVMDILLKSSDRFITCSWDKTIKMFDLNTYECIRTFTGHEDKVWCIDKISENQIVSCSAVKYGI